jgi:hypothetical protein
MATAAPAKPAPAPAPKPAPAPVAAKPAPAPVPAKPAVTPAKTTTTAASTASVNAAATAATKAAQQAAAAANAAAAATQAATKASTAAQNNSALSQIEDTLSQYGFSGSTLQSLVNFAWGEVTAGTSPAQVTLDIQNTQAFQQQFPAIKQRIAAGLPPITPAEYLSTMDSYTQALVSAGINPTTVNLNNLVAKDVSPTELNDRIQNGYLAVAMAPQEVTSAMQQYYGVTAGQLVQHFTDPTQSEASLLQQAAAAQIGGAALGSGFMGSNRNSTTSPVDAATAKLLAQQGVNFQQAQTGFANLATQAQLYQGLPGQGQVRGYSTPQLAEAQFFGGPAEQALQQQALAEKNYFNQGTNVGQSGQQTAAGAYQR